VTTTARTSEPLHVAVDLGAGSGRVFLAGVGEGELLLEEARRFQYPPERSDGHLRWNLPGILEEIAAGAREAGGRARDRGRPVHSLGVDGWGVDYGLLDDSGHLVEHPVCYRDERTQGGMELVFPRMAREEIFARTGIQFLELNTLYQIDAQVREGLPAAAARLLLVPDLVHFFLSGRAATEYTNATTTQLVNARSRTWDEDIFRCLGLPRRLFTDIVPAGTVLGPLGAALAGAPGLEGTTVVAPATHDTGSAVVGAPLEDGWAFISSGTWSLVGVEREEVLVSAGAARHNFSNEGGAFGTVRFLKNIMGLWILESCRSEWQEEGRDVSYESLLREAASVEGDRVLIFPDDPRLFNPKSMLEAMATQLAESGQRLPAEPPTVVRVILDSLALRYASVLRTAETLTARRLRGVQVVGGGSRNAYLNQATADATGLPVRAGPVEATVTGNVLVQAIARGRFGSLGDARRHVAMSLRPAEFSPRPSPALNEAARRYAALEARFLAETS
jgi:rhamnulokinase